jgi:PAS domain S-box-containing protein
MAHLPAAIRVLCIDDDSIVRENMAFYLCEHGFEVLQAENGHLGMILFRKQMPDIVITDLHMPDMDGFSVLAEMGAEFPNVPVIVCSGTGAITTAIEATRVGAWDFVIKPVTDMSLVVHIIEKAYAHFQLLEENRRYQQSLEVLVEEKTRALHERTQELETANRALRKEAADRIQAAEINRDIQLRLQSILDNTSAVIYVKNIDGRYELINKTYERIYNVKKENMLGKTDFDLFSTETASAVQSNDKKVVANSAAIQFEESIRFDDDIRTYVSVKFPLFNRGGEIYAVCGISTDITERKKMEDELRDHRKRLEEQVAQRTQELTCAKEEAERATRSKSLFLANMSHEIRTPMNGVLGMVQLLNCTHLTEEQREYLQVIEHSGEALLTIINDILDFSKIEAGQMALETEPFSLREGLNEIGYTLANHAQQKNLELIIWVEPCVPEKVLGDNVRFKQVITNLVVNAIKFTAQGEVYVHVYLEQQVNENNASIRFDVEDTGIGIAADKLPKLFGAFAQLDASTTRLFGGTGLGLSISKSLINAMGGDIQVTSQEGVGSKFWFTLRFPIVAAPSVAHEFFNKCCAWIVEGNTRSRQVLEAYLTELKIPCQSVNDYSAIKSSADTTVNILFISYPWSDSLSQAELSAFCEQQKITIVLVSRVTHRAEATQITRNMNGHLMIRPANLHQLRNCVARILNHKEYESDMNEEQELAGPASNDRRGPNILLVEDNLVNQKVTSTMLTKAGYSCTIAENGIAAIDQYKRKKWDVVLMDCHMPEMDGFEATKAIRKLEAGKKRHVPIVALTAGALQVDREKCRGAGMDAYLSKPIKRLDLFEAIDRFCLNPFPD